MYRVVPTPETLDQIAAIPDDLLKSLAEVIAVLELTPWNGRTASDSNPDSWLRYWVFGPSRNAQVNYMVVENKLEVHLLRIQWIEPSAS